MFISRPRLDFPKGITVTLNADTEVYEGTFTKGHEFTIAGKCGYYYSLLDSKGRILPNVFATDFTPVLDFDTSLIPIFLYNSLPTGKLDTGIHYYIDIDDITFDTHCEELLKRIKEFLNSTIKSAMSPSGARVSNRYGDVLPFDKKLVRDVSTETLVESGKIGLNLIRNMKTMIIVVGQRFISTTGDIEYLFDQETKTLNPLLYDLVEKNNG